MATFIIQYWMEFLFGLVTAALGFACRRFYKLYKAEKQHQKTKEQKEFYAGLQSLIKESAEESRRVEASLQGQVNAIKAGVLSLQKRDFIQSCKNLLQDDHKITLEEYENISQEHMTYNELGGNHEGDEWYRLVQAKATNNLTADK